MAILDELTEDLLMDILSRIPAKSLLRSKSVSKHWYYLIQNPNFISLHQTRAKPNYCIRFLYNPRCKQGYGPNACAMAVVPNEIIPLQYLDLSYTRPHLGDNFICRGSWNGLICLCNVNWSNIVICNPAIRECRLLPPPPYPTWHTDTLGFCFDSKTNDYRVVRIATFYSYDVKKAYNVNTLAVRKFRKVHIYSMSADSWNEIIGMVPNDVCFVRNACPCTSSDGVCFYWLCLNYSTKVTEIVALNTGDGVFKETPLPTPLPTCISLGFDKDIGLLNDSLALVLSSEDDEQLGGLRVDVWVMDKYGVEESWTKNYTFRIASGATAFGFLPNSEVLLIVFNKRKFVSYHLSTHDTKEYNPLTDSPDSVWLGKQFYLLKVFPYSENLVTVKRRVD